MIHRELDEEVDVVGFEPYRMRKWVKVHQSVVLGDCVRVPGV